MLLKHIICHFRPQLFLKFSACGGLKMEQAILRLALAPTWQKQGAFEKCRFDQICIWFLNTKFKLLVLPLNWLIKQKHSNFPFFWKFEVREIGFRVFNLNWYWFVSLYCLHRVSDTLIHHIYRLIFNLSTWGGK